ncbi:hypothetical protein ALP41_04478 [Pseudomonas savastanoi pv. nerii]|nr:hypothetical protein ALP41_04478 [Pseudomonas savastanoi pv. nerii]
MIRGGHRNSHCVRNRRRREILFSQAEIPHQHPVFRYVILAFLIYGVLLFIFRPRSRFKSTVGIKQCIDWHTNRFQNRMCEGY